ncbi:F0F1 ATP synthase subunit B [Candidatus Hepatincola sp. Pdp]
MEYIFHNLNFWLVIAFLIALALFAKKAYVAFNNILTNEIKHIVKDIEDSKELYNQSFSLINEKKEKLKDLTIYKNKFLTNVKHKADTYYEKIINKLDQNLQNSKKSFNNYLHHVEKDLIQKESDKILEESIQNVRTIIKNNTTEKEHIVFIDDSILNITKLMNKKHGE